MKNYIAMAAMLIIAGTAYFGCRSHREEDSVKRAENRAEWIVEKLSDELELTAEQQKTLNGIKDEVVARHKEIKELHSGVYNDVLLVLDKESVTEQELNAMFTQRETQWKELREFAVAKFTQFHNTLSKEQKSRLKELAEKFRRHRG